MKKISTPLTFDSIHGTIMSVDEKTEIRASVKTILMTTAHERLVSPLFGTRLSDYVFSLMEYTTLEMIKKEVTLALLKQEPRIRDVQVTFQHQRELEHTLYVFVTYQLVNAAGSDTFTLTMNQEGIAS